MNAITAKQISDKNRLNYWKTKTLKSIEEACLKGYSSITLYYNDLPVEGRTCPIAHELAADLIANGYQVVVHDFLHHKFPVIDMIISWK